MSNLSELLPTGGGQNAVDFVASGTLSSGQTVILNSNGTVSAVAETPQELGTQATFVSATIDLTSVVYDVNAQKVVIFYQDDNNSFYGTAVVGTVSGSTLSFGTPVVFQSTSLDTGYMGAVYHVAANKIVTAYRVDSGANPGKAIVGTVSGTSISFGTDVNFNATDTRNIAITYDSSAQKVIIAFSDFDNSRYGAAVVGTVSGTSISFGSKVNFETAISDHISCVYDSSANKTVIAYRDVGNSDYGTAVVGTVSGTSISFGSPVVFTTSAVLMTTTVYDSSNDKTVIAYRDEGNSNYGTAVVGTVSGTSISFGTPVVFDSTYVTMLSASYFLPTGKIVIAYKDQTSNNGDLVVGTVSETSISFDSPFTYNSGLTRYIGTTYNSTAEKIIIAYSDGTTVGAANTFSTSISNNTDFIGITAEAISDTATGAVNVYGGINEAQTGLTIGSDYYVQADGSLSTTASSVKVGQAISATTINMMDLT